MIIHYTLTKHTRKLKNDAVSLMLTFFCFMVAYHLLSTFIKNISFNSKGWDLTASVTR